MHLRSAVEFALVVLFCVGSGDLECERALAGPERRGRALYHRMCAVCHGREGEGYAADEAPALAHPDFLASAPDEYLRTAIASGRPGTTMSAWAAARSGPLSGAEVDALVAFIRHWRPGPQMTLDERPVLGDVPRGADIFARECSRCHGQRGTGGPEIHVGSPELLASATNGFLREAIRSGRRGTPMASFDRKLGNAGVEDVVALLRSWQWSSPEAAPPATPPAKIPIGPTPLHPHGPEPVGFRAYPETTSVETLKAQLDRGARVGILDARAPSDYLGIHIAGAVSVPFYDPDPYLSSLAKNAWLVCYCACPHAESGQLAQKLVASGFKKVTVLDEGLGVWRARNYPTHVGADP